MTALVTFTENIQRHVSCPPQKVEGATVREVLDAVFANNPKARGYVLDEHGALRKHMIIFINGEGVRDRAGLSDPVIQDVHRLVQSPSNPDVMWVQHHNAIFRSRDCGRHWDDIDAAQPSVFGFAVAVHPHDPATAWFVPAIKDEKCYPVDGKLVVSRTRDGGETFEVHTAGLPQSHAYDLVYRHALDVDQTGKRLVFGSTTGGVWISEDAGDSWAQLDARLPPVAAVRFG